MPPIRTFHVLIEDTFADGDGTVFQTYSHHCIAYQPYDIRDRGEMILRMRAFREAEMFAQQAKPKELPRPPPSAKEVERQKEKMKRKEQEEGIREKTVFPSPPADEVRILPVAKMGGKGCLEPLSQLDVLPEDPPLTLQSLTRNDLQLTM
ncbi:hypothetical protein BDY19DRAFT_903021 [Irpex rosettiformis]|uniref:Uncharacterized protein n=1 Tax=Irpex rosettiformis TaxID=378272 RepID=A0ACB8UHT2_9APHY|nr:hypothetical protein BDY19DRAFT_903021 [Irpex rosettiformis]